MTETANTAVITGATGLLGKHIAAWLQYEHGYSVRRLKRADWATAEDLAAAIDGCGVFCHFAALNRASEEEVDEVNAALTRRVTDALAMAKTPPATVVYSNSIQIDRGNTYGNIKKRAGEEIGAAALDRGSNYINAVLPNVFGEAGKPFSNSVVHTFCHQIANGEQPTILTDGEMEQIHVNEVAKLIVAAIEKVGPRAAGNHETLRPAGRKIRVTQLLAMLQQMDGSYRSGVIPALGDPFEVALFNTLRSYYYPSMFPIVLKHFTDNRGALAECIRAGGGGQVFFSTTHPGITRGNHFHFGKVERFIVLQGRARISMRSMVDDGVRHDFDVDGDKPCAVDMPTLFTHNITNTGDTPLITLFWTNEFFDPERPDTYPEIV